MGVLNEKRCKKIKTMYLYIYISMSENSKMIFNNGKQKLQVSAIINKYQYI